MSRKLNNYKIVTEFEELKKYNFDTFISSDPNATIFQTEDIFSFYKSIPNYEPFIRAIVSVTDKIKAFTTGSIMSEKGLLKHFSARAVIDGGILVDFNEPDKNYYLNALLMELDKLLSRKVIYAEIRNLFDYSGFKNTFNFTGWKYFPYLDFIVDCRDYNSLVKKISKSKLRQVKKSLEAGTEIVYNPSQEEVRKFYFLLSDLYKNKVKKPLRPYEFFMSFNNNLGKYFLIKYQGEIIGGIMCPIYKNKYIYEWFVVGDSNYKWLYPSIVATWTAIDYANKNNIEFFDFMGAGPPDKKYGVREFKAKFGGELVEYGRFFKIYKGLLYKIGKTYIKVSRSSDQY